MIKTTIMKPIKNILFLAGLCAAILLTAGCDKTDDGKSEKSNPLEISDPIEEPTDEKSIVGDWKLNGIVDAQTGKLTELEPKDCEKCYTLTFSPETEVYTLTPSNLLSGEYEADYKTNTLYLKNLFITAVNELHEDGILYRRFFSTVQSFSLQDGELRLYNNDQKEYLSYKVRE